MMNGRTMMHKFAKPILTGLVIFLSLALIGRVSDKPGIRRYLRVPQLRRTYGSSLNDAISSAFRQRMDQLLMSCRRRQMHASENEDEDPSMSHTQLLGIQEGQQNKSQLYEWEREDEEQEFLKALQHEGK
ncbi:hypothetical protein AKJ16_DCAP04665 [Drosera capensis]